MTEPKRGTLLPLVVLCLIAKNLSNKYFLPTQCMPKTVEINNSRKSEMVN